MDKYFMWIHYERLHNHNKAKHNKTVCIFLWIYCMCPYKSFAAMIWINFSHDRLCWRKRLADVALSTCVNTNVSPWWESKDTYWTVQHWKDYEYTKWHCICNKPVQWIIVNIVGVSLWDRMSYIWFTVQKCAHNVVPRNHKVNSIAVTLLHRCVCVCVCVYVMIYVFLHRANFEFNELVKRRLVFHVE